MLKTPINNDNKEERPSTPEPRRGRNILATRMFTSRNNNNNRRTRSLGQLPPNIIGSPVTPSPSGASSQESSPAQLTAFLNQLQLSPAVPRQRPIQIVTATQPSKPPPPPIQPLTTRKMIVLPYRDIGSSNEQNQPPNKISSLGLGRTGIKFFQRPPIQQPINMARNVEEPPKDLLSGCKNNNGKRPRGS